MIAILLAGIVSGIRMRREFFPESDPDQAQITLRYPGATPDEIEQTLAIKVEDKLAEMDEIDEMQTTLSEGGGGIVVTFREGIDVDKTVDDIERLIDALTDLPEESEQIEVSLVEPRIPVIRVTVYGELDEHVMKRMIRGVRDDLRSLPNMGETLIEGVRDYEMRVDVGREALIKHGVSLPQIVDRIKAWMIDMPGGTVRSSSGNIKVRTMGVAERDKAIRQIVLLSDSAGQAVHVGDVADVTESFVDEQIITRFNGLPATTVTVYKVGGQDIVNMAQMVRAYVEGRRVQKLQPTLWERIILAAPQRLSRVLTSTFRQDRIAAWRLGLTSDQPLPTGAQIDTHSDFARFVEGRLDLLLRNATYGAILVFCTLLMVLNWRVALWVGVGLLCAIMGTLVLMAWFDVTLNLLTMFGLIVVLGLLVDDAIIVSENFQTLYDEKVPALTAAVRGTEQVLWPVVATVLTSVAAFIPLTFIKGRMGDLLGALPMVVACALLMSLLESLMILPTHLAHSFTKTTKTRNHRLAAWIQRVKTCRDDLVLERLVPLYARALELVLTYRYISIAVAIGTLIISLGLVKGEHVQFTFLPTSDSETIIIDLRMPIGTSIEKSNEVVARIERATRQQKETKSVASIVGQRVNFDTGANELFASHVAQMYVELVLVEDRDRESSQIIASIRDAISGQIDEVERITFTEISGGPEGPDISIQVRGDNVEHIKAAAAELKRCLGGYKGVHDIYDDNQVGQPESQINLKRGAAALGFTTADVAQQVRGSLYGLDAHVFVDRQEDIDVRVRLDETTRRNLFAIENSWVVSPEGKAVPLSEITTIESVSSYATIKRIDRQRAIRITAATAPWLSPETIVKQLTGSVSRLNGDQANSFRPVDELRRRYSDLKIEFTGRQKQLADAFASLPLGFAAALVMIYVILAWLFSSYFQPILVMLVVPFALIGVIWGHLILGYELTFLSLIGFVALSGIVVNDSLILVQFYNVQRREGRSVFDSLIAAGRARLRAILLTTITTVFGLTPLILEQSFQAKFLIPMAISIAMGLISATILVLMVLPCFLLVFDDLRTLTHWLWYGHWETNVAQQDSQ